MGSFDETSVLRRKLGRLPAPMPAGGTGADRSWRVVLARAARDALSLGLDVQTVTQSRVSLAEVLEMPPNRALIAMLDGPGGGLGLMALSAPLLAAMTEMQTIGRVSALTPPPRKPTRTDAAMVAGFVDTALTGLDASLGDDADLVWAGGFRYASFLDDARPLGLLLDDIAYRVLLADVTVEGGTRAGQIVMALPADGRGERPRVAPHALSEAAASRAFATDLAHQLDGAQCVLQAVIHRMQCPLSAVFSLNIGDMLPLPLASLDRVGFEGLDGQRVAEGRLGQNRGMRAVRLTPPPQASRSMADKAHADAPLRHDAPDIIDVQKVVAAG